MDRGSATAKRMVWLTASVLAGGLLAGCGDTREGTDASAGDAKPGKVVEKDQDHTLFERPDGTRVDLRYRPGRGLTERHRADGAWSAEHVVHRTKTAPCQGITVRGQGERVAVIADFATNCRDGDPPMENVAAVGDGPGLDHWAAKGTRGSDGWEKIRFGADSVAFSERWSAGTASVTWSEGKGFGEKQQRYKPLRTAYVGRWTAADGSHTLSFEQAGDGPPQLTVSTLKGEPCTAVVRVLQVDATSVEMRGEPRVTRGATTGLCPPDPFETEYELGADGDSLTLTDFTRSPRKHLMTYERSR
ncbi:hypothetical protein ACGFS9_19720 [Streptomyces sp. NPDC048566]|uniref:hypothetical protein n=1 Tax=Streptomyces sp. NPDC048566 TaxID=3365569 RepID=UPI0037228CDA